MMTTNEKELYKKFLLFRGHEITRDKNFIYEKKGDWYYKQICLEYNYRITDIQCALGISQLKKRD